MKVNKIFSGVVFMFIGLLSLNAHADVQVNCSWTQTGYTYYGPTPLYVYTCMDGSVAAAVWRKAANGGTYCDINAASGYYTSSCSEISPKVYKVVASSSSPSVTTSSSSSSVCPKAGQSINVPQGRYDLAAAYCSPCNFHPTGSTAGPTITTVCY